MYNLSLWEQDEIEEAELQISEKAFDIGKLIIDLPENKEF